MIGRTTFTAVMLNMCQHINKGAHIFCSKQSFCNDFPYRLSSAVGNDKNFMNENYQTMYHSRTEDEDDDDGQVQAMSAASVVKWMKYVYKYIETDCFIHNRMIIIWCVQHVFMLKNGGWIDGYIRNMLDNCANIIVCMYNKCGWWLVSIHKLFYHLPASLEGIIFRVFKYCTRYHGMNSIWSDVKEYSWKNL